MDPDATLRRFLDACRDHAKAKTPAERIECGADAQEALSDLSNWLWKGGFLPQDPRQGEP